jgi:putative transposase
MRTLKQHLRKLTKSQYQVLRDFCHYSNNLYNYSLYVCKQYYEQTGQYIGYNQLWHEVKANENAKLLPSQMSRQTVMLVDKNFRSFFALLQRKKRGEYAADVHPPRFRKRGDVFLLVCPLPGFSIQHGYVSLHASRYYQQSHGKQKFHIPFTYEIPGVVKQLIIKPLDNGRAFTIYYQYEEQSIDKPSTDIANKLSLDIGINNLVTGIVYPTGHSFIVNGKPLKSYNCWYNKTKARLQSELDTKQHVKKSHRLSRMSQNRDWFIDNFFNQAVNYIVKRCCTDRIGTVVIGYNATWKQCVGLGKRTNQHFTYIPYLRFINKLTVKLESLGITIVLHEESYTSKCSFIDRETMCHHDTYVGVRVKRGLFRTASKQHVNADVNGAANILRKVIGNAVYDSNLIVGLMLAPVKIHIFTKKTGIMPHCTYFS